MIENYIILYIYRSLSCASFVPRTSFCGISALYEYVVCTKRMIWPFLSNAYFVHFLSLPFKTKIASFKVLTWSNKSFWKEFEGLEALNSKLSRFISLLSFARNAEMNTMVPCQHPLPLVSQKRSMESYDPKLKRFVCVFQNDVSTLREKFASMQCKHSVSQCVDQNQHHNPPLTITRSMVTIHKQAVIGPAASQPGATDFNWIGLTSEIVLKKCFASGESTEQNQVVSILANGQNGLPALQYNEQSQQSLKQSNIWHPFGLQQRPCDWFKVFWLLQLCSRR